MCCLFIDGTIIWHRLMYSQKSHQPNKPRKHFFYGYIIILLALLIMTIMYGARMSFGVFFKPVIYEFDWSRAMMSGAFSMSTLVQGILGIVMGSLNDRLGPRVVLTLSGIFMGLGYLLLSQISAAWQLYLFYVLIIGVGMGGVFVPLLSTV